MLFQPPPNRFVAIFLHLVSAVLICAAVLKVFGLNYSPVANDPRQFDLRLELALIFIEIGVGVWMLSGKLRPSAWLAAFLLFCVFTTFTVRSVIRGEAKCGCFGALEVKPHWTLLFDLAILGVLLAYAIRNDSATRGFIASITAGWKPLAMVVSASVLAVGILLAVVVLAFGSVERAYALVRGDAVYATTMSMDIGVGSEGETATGSIELRNESDREVRVIAGTANCVCVATADLPKRIPPHDAVRIPVNVFLRNEPGNYTHRVVLVLDHPEQRQVRFTVKVSILPQ